MTKEQFDTDSHANALRKRLGLEPTDSPNRASDTARVVVEDLASGFSYFERLLGLLRDPPRGTRPSAVRGFLGHVYAWADFAVGACLAFDDAVQFGPEHIAQSECPHIHPEKEHGQGRDEVEG